MKKTNQVSAVIDSDPDVLDEYDFSGGKRGVYAERYAQGTNLVELLRDAPVESLDLASIYDEFHAMSIGKVAIHEAGHALIGFLKGWGIKKISIIPNGARDSFGECDFDPPSKTGLKDTCMIYLGGLAAQRVALCEDEDYREQDDYKTAIEQVIQVYKPNGYSQFVEQDVSGWLSETADILQHYNEALLAVASRIEAEPTKVMNGREAEGFLAARLTR
ncbi:MAG: hypothetical protein M3Y56_07055 [Armatimonadota bacterium]|nr:hypothetical protein [Armatimonadota bacterium]